MTNSGAGETGAIKARQKCENKWVYGAGKFAGGIPHGSEQLRPDMGGATGFLKNGSSAPCCLI